MLTREEITENLCAYDKRNPYYLPAFGERPSGECFCEACFYGNTPLAEALLELDNKYHFLQDEKS